MASRILAVALIAAAVPMIVCAQSAAPDCTRVDNDAERLDCYDRQHGRKKDAPSSPAAPTAHRAPSAPQATILPAPPPRADTSLDARWDLDGRKGELFAPRVYRPVYLLAADWTSNPNREPSSPSVGHQVPSPLELQPIEAKYQISFKSKIAHSLFGTPVSLWGAYTQSSRWQVYNAADSRPFRETNYEPEIMFVMPLDNVELPGGGRLRMASLSFNHQSNGRALPLSRSWNRVIGSVLYENGDWTAELRPWVRVPERAVDDDNPDISDYAGRGEMRITRRWGEQFLSVQLRHSLRGGSRSHGSAQVDYVFPLVGALHGQVQLFSGYAESMIDYNVRQTRIGFGVTIAGWQ